MGPRVSELRPSPTFTLGVSPEQRRYRNEQFQGLIRRLGRRRALLLQITLCAEAQGSLTARGLFSYISSVRWHRIMQ
jgi:hypothetical protein